MKLQHWVYATTENCIDRDTVVNKMNAIADILRGLDFEHKAFGWSVIPVVETGDYADFDVDPCEVESVTGGQLPFLYMCLSFDLDKLSPTHPALQAIIKDHHFQLALKDPEQT